MNKGKLYGLRVYAKAFKRYVSLAIWYPMDGRTDILVDVAERREEDVGIAAIVV